MRSMSIYICVLGCLYSSVSPSSDVFLIFRPNERAETLQHWCSIVVGPENVAAQDEPVHHEGHAWSTLTGVFSKYTVRSLQHLPPSLRLPSPLPTLLLQSSVPPEAVHAHRISLRLALRGPVQVLISAMVDIRSRDARIMAQGSVLSHNIGSIGDIQVKGGLHIHGAGRNEDNEDGRKTEGWLASVSPDFITSHENARDLQSPGTGLWFLKSINFQRWFNGEVPHLSCVGKPGAGKTIMSSIVIDYLEENCRDSLILFAYIRDDQRTMHTLRHFLCALFLQLIRKQHSVSSATLALYNGKNELPPLKRLSEAFQDVLSTSSYEKVFIVVDALDEWKSTQSFPDTADNLVLELEELHHAKVLITSRHRIPFSSDDVYTSEPISATSEDVVTFVNYRIRRGLLKRVKVSEELKEEIVAKVEKQANGMFIIARLLVDRLERCSTYIALRTELDTIPTNLRELYLTTLDRIWRQDPVDVQHASMLFAWMVYAKQSLTADEIIHGVAACTNSLCANLTDGIVDEGYLLSISGGLIVVSEEEVWTRSGKAPRFMFVHFTIKEFLLDMAIKYFPRAEILIAEGCLRYLSFALPLLPSDVSEHIVQCDKELDCERLDLFHPFCLFNYAANFWYLHACVDGNHIDHCLVFHLYQHPLAPYMNHGQSYSREVTPASTMTLEAYLVLLLSFGGQICMLKGRIGDSLTTCRDRRGRSVISLASQGGHVAIMQLILDQERAPQFSAGEEESKEGAVNLLSVMDSPLERDGSNDHGRTLLSHAAGWMSAATRYLPLDRNRERGRPSQAGRTPLSYAAAEGNSGRMSLLVNHGADIDEADRHGRTPLIWAAGSGRVEAVRLLLDRGAEVDKADELYGRTPLGYAAQAGLVETIELLLDRGAVLDRADKERLTPLSLAALNGHVDAMKVLLDRGAGVDKVDENGRTPLSWAAKYRHVEAVRLLLDRGAEVDKADELQGGAPLGYATQAGHVETIELILDRGAALDRAEKGGWTPLSLAAVKGHVDAMKILLDRGAGVDKTDEKGRTPLSWADRNGHVEAVRLLLQRGAEVDNLDELYGRTPLGYATQAGHVETIELLLDRGAVLDRAYKEGWTPLFVAALNGNVDAMKVLLDRGAGVDKVDENGRTPLSWAAQYRHVEAVRLLLARGAEVDKADELYGRTPLGYATQAGHVETIELILDRGAALDRAEKGGWTPLSLAAVKGHVDAMKILLDRGAGVDKADEKGRTPLSWAARNGHVEAVRLLLQRGAEVDNLDELYARTPLGWAAQVRRQRVRASRTRLSLGVVLGDGGS